MKYILNNESCKSRLEESRFESFNVTTNGADFVTPDFQWQRTQLFCVLMFGIIP